MNNKAECNHTDQPEISQYRQSSQGEISEKVTKSVKKKKMPSSINRTELKRRARIIVNEMINGSTAQDAIIKAGYSSKTPVTHIINSKQVQATFNQILEKTGLTDEAIAGKLKALFDAKETKFFADKGIVTETREVEALAIQLDTAKTLLKIKGYDKSTTGPTVNNTYIDLRSYSNEENSQVVDITQEKK